MIYVPRARPDCANRVIDEELVAADGVYADPVRIQTGERISILISECLAEIPHPKSENGDNHGVRRLPTFIR